MKLSTKRGTGEDLVMTLAFALLATIATAQPYTAPGYNYGPPSLVELAQPDQSTKVLGIFKTKCRASNTLRLSGLVAMTTGSVFAGIAAKKAAVYGTLDGDTGPYHTTRFVGDALRLTGTASYAIGWTLKDWNPWANAKRPFWRKHGQVIEGIGEAAFLFCFNSLVSQTAYTLHTPKPYR